MATSRAAPRGAAVVTGTSTGIGRACALRLDRMGFRVFAGVRKEADGESLKEKTAGRATPLLIDVTNDSSITSAAEAVAAAVGDEGLAGLVNNAGIAVAGPLEFLPLEDIRRQLEVNVIGQIAVTQAFLPLVREGRGRIVYMGSIGGRLATPFIAPYNASKFALEAVTDALRMELRPWGISVSIIEPGSIDTPLWERGQSTANEIEEKLPQRAHELYDPAMAAMRKAAETRARAGISPDAVARAVAHALTARRPKTRYLVGLDSRIQATLVRLLPDGLRDSLITRFLGLPREA